MINILLATSQSRESHILVTALRQKGYMVKVVPAIGASYLALQKSKPSIIFVEILKIDSDQVHFIQQVTTNKILADIPVLCYGNSVDKEGLTRYIRSGAKMYLSRPLKLGLFLELISDYVLKQSAPSFNEGSDTEPDKPRYFDILLNPTRLVSQKLNIMNKQVDNAKVFPFTIAKIISLTANTSTSIKDLTKAIESDPTMSANTLKVSNSVFFRSKYRVNSQIKTIPEAIMRIGFQQTKKIATSLMVAELINKEENSFGFNREDFWFHSIATAIIAEEIAKKCEFKEHSLAYLAGLLHDYGVVVYDDYLLEIFVPLLEYTFTNHTTIEQAGMHLLGLTHNEFTYELFQSWNLPNELAVSVRYHKQFLDIPDKSLPETVETLSKITGLANILAKCSTIGRSCDEYVHPIPDDFFKKKWPNNCITSDFFEPVFQQVAMYKDFFNLHNRKFPTTSYVSGPEDKPYTMVILNFDPSKLEPHLLYLKNIGFTLLPFTDITEFTEQATSQSIDLAVINTTVTNPYSSFERHVETLHSRSVPKLIFGDLEELEKITEDDYTQKLPKSLELHLIIDAIDRLFRKYKSNFISISNSGS